MTPETFDKLRVLPDSLFPYSAGGGDAFDVSQFLIDKNSLLRNYYTPQGSPANLLIKNTARAFNVNVKLILVTLEREQGLIEFHDMAQLKNYTKPNGKIVNPLSWACGVGLLQEGEVLPQYEGFAVQLKEAGYIYRKYFNAKIVGQHIYDTNEFLTPLNQFTNALAWYVPDVGAWKTTRNLWLRYWPEDKKGEN